MRQFRISALALTVTQEVQARLMPGPDQPIHLCVRVLLDGEVIETRIPMEVIEKVVAEAHENAKAL